MRIKYVEMKINHLISFKDIFDAKMYHAMAV